MSAETPNGNAPAQRTVLAGAVAARSRANVVAGLRGLGGSAGTSTTGARRAAAPADPDVECCDLCGVTIPEDHRHLLNLVQRRIECSCESCWALRSGDAEYRPVGSRTLWLKDLQLPDELWASFQIPIGLAFFMESTTAGCVVAMYPSPAGATESELHFATWQEMVNLNPVLDGLERDIEGLIVNRVADPPVYAIAPIDRCYALTGAIKASWEGISGGSSAVTAIGDFFTTLQAEATVA